MKVALSILVLLTSCTSNEFVDIPSKTLEETTVAEESVRFPIADQFEFPVGAPDGKGYYNAQKFGENSHLGDDWNGLSGGNTDLGDPIYSTANGIVKEANDIGGGWGKVIRVLHRLPDSSFVESIYAHCDSIYIQQNDTIKLGQQIGTIGNVDGIYKAHLHFEIRTNTELPIGGGYGTDINGYVDPTEFIKAH